MYIATVKFLPVKNKPSAEVFVEAFDLQDAIHKITELFTSQGVKQSALRIVEIKQTDRAIRYL